MIIRRILKCGAEVGRYIEITKKTTQGYFGRTLRKSFEFFVAEKLTNFKKIEICSVQVTMIEFEALKHAVHVHHELSPQWENVLKKNPEIIKVRNKTDVLYIFPQVIKRRILCGIPNIYIEIKTRELYELDSKKA